MEWLQRIVDEESTKPLQVPKNYVQGYTKQATEYSRQISNSNARRSYTLHKIQGNAQGRATRRARETEYKRRWNATKGEHGEATALSNASGSVGEDDDGALDEISQLAAQVRAQAERHAVDGSLPLEDTVGADMADEYSLVSAGEQPSMARQTVFRKKRTESRLRNPAQTYYTVKQTASEGDLSMGQSSEFGDETSGGPPRSNRRSKSRSSADFNNTTMSLGSMSMNSALSRDHIEKLEQQRASIRAQRELSKRHAEEARIKLAESERRSDQVIRAWAKKQRDVNKAKNRAYRQAIARDRRFIQDSQAVISHVRTWNDTPPLELMHCSTALAKKKKEEKRLKKEGRVVEETKADDDDDDEEGTNEVRTVMEAKAGVTIVPPGEGRRAGKQRGAAKSRDGADGGSADEPAPAPAPVVAAAPSFNPLAASGYDMERPATGGSGRGVSAEVDSHMLLDEETEFQLSRLESQQDGLEDWSRSLQHQLPTIPLGQT